MESKDNEVGSAASQPTSLLLSTHKFCPWDHMYALITIALFSNYVTKNLDVYRTKMLALLPLLFGAGPSLEKPLPLIHRPSKKIITRFHSGEKMLFSSHMVKLVKPLLTK